MYTKFFKNFFRLFSNFYNMFQTFSIFFKLCETFPVFSNFSRLFLKLLQTFLLGNIFSDFFQIFAIFFSNFFQTFPNFYELLQTFADFFRNFWNFLNFFQTVFRPFSYCFDILCMLLQNHNYTKFQKHIQHHIHYTKIVWANFILPSLINSIDF